MREVLDLARLIVMGPDEAAGLLSARMRDQTSEHDEAVLADWLAHDTRHVIAWERAQWMLALFEGNDENGMRAELREEARGVSSARTSGWPRWAAIAAVVVALIVGVTALKLVAPWNNNSPKGVEVAQTRDGVQLGQIYSASLDATRRIELPDGSTLTLDRDSSVRLAFTQERRTLQLLRGRAAFDVRHDATRPFAVRAANREVVALGTRFDVVVGDDEFRVVLVEGRVAIASTISGSRPIELRAGQQLVEIGGKPAQISQINVEEVSKWQNGIAVFEDTPLSDVITELNKYTDEQLIIRDPSVARLKVTGTFRTGNLARFARTIAETHPVRVLKRSATEWEIVMKSEREKSLRRK